jgi:exosortase/archaeosortase
MININKNNLIKYLIMFVVVTVSTRVIPTCGVLQQHAIYVGLIGASTFALIDTCYPNYVMIDGNKDNHNY